MQRGGKILVETCATNPPVPPQEVRLPMPSSSSLDSRAISRTKDRYSNATLAMVDPEPHARVRNRAFV